MHPIFADRARSTGVTDNEGNITFFPETYLSFHHLSGVFPRFQPIPVAIVDLEDADWQTALAQISGNKLQILRWLTTSNSSAPAPGVEEGQFKDVFSTIPAATLTNHYPVELFGARGDGLTDDTQSFQMAFDAASGTGIVTAGEGTFKLTNEVAVWHNTGFLGSNRSFQAHRGTQEVTAVTGTMLLHSMSDVAGKCMLRMHDYAWLQGFTIYDPAIAKTSGPPMRPWAVSSDTVGARGCRFENIQLVNTAFGIYHQGGGRVLFRDITGTPSRVGIWADANGDTCRFESCQFDSSWTNSEANGLWIKASGLGVRLGRIDFCVMDNCLIQHMHTAIELVNSTNPFFDGAADPHATNCSFDECAYGIRISGARPYSPLQIDNCEFVDMTHSAIEADFHPSGEYVAPGPRANIQISNSSFRCWNNMQRPFINVLYGYAQLTNNTYFFDRRSFPSNHPLQPFLMCHSGGLIFNSNWGSGFTVPIRLEPTMHQAIITSNILGSGIRGTAAQHIYANNIL